MWAWPDVLQHPRQLPVCGHTLSRRLPAGLQPGVREDPAGRAARGGARDHQASPIACLCLDPHFQEGFPRPKLAALPEILGGGGGVGGGRCKCWHTRQTCTQAETNLPPCCVPCMVMRAAPQGVLSRTENAPLPLYTHNLGQKAPPNTEIRESSQTPGLSSLCS